MSMIAFPDMTQTVHQHRQDAVVGVLLPPPVAVLGAMRPVLLS